MKGPATPHWGVILSRDIEWSLRAFASMQALRLFLRARTVIKFVLRAASTLENTAGDSEHFLTFPLILHVGLLECAQNRNQGGGGRGGSNFPYILLNKNQTMFSQLAKQSSKQ